MPATENGMDRHDSEPGDRRAALRAAVAAGVAAVLPALARAQADVAEPADPLRRAVRARRQLGDRRPLDRGRADQAARAERLSSRTSRAAPATSRWPRSPRPTDQHTLVLGHIGTLAVNPFIFDKLPYDPIKDFKPVSLLAKVPSLYVVHPDVPAKNLKEFVALAKAKPGQLNYGSAGNGSAGHLAFEYLKMVTGIFVAARAVSRHRAAAHRPARRPAARRVGRRAGDPAVHQDRQAPLHRHRHGAADPAAARRADGRRAGLAGLRDDAVVRPDGAGQPRRSRRSTSSPPRRRKAVREPAALERLNTDAAIAVGGTPAEFAAFIAQRARALEAGDRAREDQARLGVEPAQRPSRRPGEARQGTPRAGDVGVEPAERPARRGRR